MHKSINEEIEQFIGDLTLYYPKKNTIVLVEDREDMAFWKHIIQEFAPHIKPDFPLLSSTGKSTLRKYVNHVSKEVFICIDSDNDFYHKTMHTEWLNPRKPYIYQTYSHSRENYFIYPNNLQQVCESLINIEYDFNSDFKQISEAFYDWLTIWLFFTDSERTWLNKEIDNFAVEIAWKKLENIINNAYIQVNFDNIQLLSEVKDISTIFKELILEHKEFLFKIILNNGYEYLLPDLNDFQQSCSIQPQETLYFIQGHIAFDKIILPYFTKVIQVLALDLAKEETTDDRRNHFQNRSKHKDYNDLLRDSYHRCFSSSNSCRFMEQIKHDIISDF